MSLLVNYCVKLKWVSSSIFVLYNKRIFFMSWYDGSTWLKCEGKGKEKGKEKIKFYKTLYIIVKYFYYWFNEFYSIHTFANVTINKHIIRHQKFTKVQMTAETFVWTKTNLNRFFISAKFESSSFCHLFIFMIFIFRQKS